MTEFNKTKQFEKDMKQNISEIVLYCRQNDIPFYMTFCTASGENFTEYVTDTIMPPELGMELHEDRFRKIVLAKQGFDLVKQQNDLFDLDDVDEK